MFFLYFPESESHMKFMTTRFYKLRMRSFDIRKMQNLHKRLTGMMLFDSDTDFPLKSLLLEIQKKIPEYPGENC